MNTITIERDNINYSITYGLEWLKGNEHPYFSFTYDTARNGFGADLDLINDIAPMLAEFTPLHLADINGAPMHAAANAVYWAGLTKYGPFDQRTLCKHLRISPVELPDELTEQSIEALVEELRPRWKAEADRCIAQLQLTIPEGPR